MREICSQSSGPSTVYAEIFLISKICYWDAFFYWNLEFNFSSRSSALLSFSQRFVETFWALAMQCSNVALWPSQSPSCLPEYIPLTLFLVMLQLATNLEPRKLCSCFLCVLRVYCVNGHAFGLCPGFWVRLLPLTWNNYCCSLPLCVR